MAARVVAVSLLPLLVCAAVLGYEFHTAYRAKVRNPAAAQALIAKLK